MRSSSCSRRASRAARRRLSSPSTVMSVSVRSGAEQQRQRRREYVRRPCREPRRQRRHARVHIAHHQHRHGPKGHEAPQAHAAVDVQKALGIVPPAGVKELFHRPGGQVFQRCGQNGAGRNSSRRAVLQRRKDEDHRHRARAVDGAHRPVEKAAVDQLFAGHGAEDALIHPADEAVNGRTTKTIAPADEPYRPPNTLIIRE